MALVDRASKKGSPKQKTLGPLCPISAGPAKRVRPQKAGSLHGSSRDRKAAFRGFAALRPGFYTQRQGTVRARYWRVRPRGANPLIISVAGLRGVVGKSLTPEVAIRYTTAFAQGLPAGPVLIGRDGRESGPMLAAAISAGLADLGRDVIDAGVVATPTVGMLVKARGAGGGIQISASHNPAQYNGLKLFSAEGRVLPAKRWPRVLDRYRQLRKPVKSRRPARVAALSPRPATQPASTLRQC